MYGAPVMSQILFPSYHLTPAPLGGVNYLKVTAGEIEVPPLVRARHWTQVCLTSCGSPGSRSFHLKVGMPLVSPNP